MLNKIPVLEDVVELTRYLLHRYYEGDYESIFPYICPQSILVNEGKAIFGGEAVKDYLSKNPYNPLTILNEEIYAIPMGKGASLAIGDLKLGDEGQTYIIEDRFTIAYRLVECETKFVYLHHSFRFIGSGATEDSARSVLPINVDIVEFVHGLFLNRPTETSTRVPIHFGGQTMLLQPLVIMYIHGNGKKTEVVCVDRILSCNTSIGEMEMLCPPEFWKVHRSYIVNTRYVTSIKRYKLELISGITVPIPANSYMEIKQRLIENFSVSNKMKRTREIKKKAPVKSQE